jgi:hypothetical protein
MELRIGFEDLITEYNYRGINKSLQWAALEDLTIHRIHLCITQEEMDKESKSKYIYLSLSLNSRSSCADGHVRLPFVTFHEP